MPNYMLLLYTPHERPPVDDPGMHMSRWWEYTKSLEDAGVLVAIGRLHPTDAATTVRERDGETLVTDGPFAETNEYLGGYYLLDCPNLDVALQHAARVPHIHFGSVEVRPVMTPQEAYEGLEEAAAEA